MERVNRKMTAAEWDSIVAVCLVDEQRMTLFNQLSTLSEKFVSGDPTFKDVDTWFELKDKLVEREWQILVEKGKLEK